MNISEQKAKSLNDKTASYINLVNELPCTRVTANLNNDLMEKLVKSLAIIVGQDSLCPTTELEKSEIIKSKNFLRTFLSLYYSEKNIDNLMLVRTIAEDNLRSDVFGKKFEMEKALEYFNDVWDKQTEK